MKLFACILLFLVRCSLLYILYLISFPNKGNIKQAVADDIIPGGYFVPKGTEVQFNAYTVKKKKIKHATISKN